jgi:hypothetical protein
LLAGNGTAELQLVLAEASIVQAALFELLFRTAFGKFRTLEVDVFTQLRNIRQNRDMAVEDLKEAGGDGSHLPLSATCAPEKGARLQFAHKIRMARQNIQLALEAGNEEFVHSFLFDELAMRRENRQIHLEFLGLLDSFFDRANHVEGLLGEVVVLAFKDFLEALNGVRNFNVLAGRSRELLGDEEGL